MSGNEDPNAPGTTTEQNSDPPATEGPGQDTTQPGAPPVEPPPPPQDWRDRRIGEQQQRLRERNARIAELEAQLRVSQPAQPGQPGQPAAPTGNEAYYQQSDIQRQINEAAAAMAAQQEFTRRCNEVAESGRRVYNNFDGRVQRLVGLIDANDQQAVRAYNSFLNAAMETGQAPKLIYDLGGDLNEASRIMAMEPMKMAVELTRMAARATTTDQSMAPRPLNPVASTGGVNNRAPIHPDDPDNSDTLSTEEWMRRREEQVASRRQRTLG